MAGDLFYTCLVQSDGIENFLQSWHSNSAGKDWAPGGARPALEPWCSAFR
ncbi:hypothetical protein GGTG_13525 [Gaeumannomyces tritici R3-111a-1]|uniref:Uncharacterized protein n=1 Tax=Gaeumannomyces tritici (strain R3-111a-1) TaxID=644352 RepID=J3PJ42_GAET3|nr:hypothetical protein GGTG_13525 [Gaeumannomyces tritici R3-111a-1]EJT68936.1 hypothetical protein GGTG_13525 [Gaeumannomyces tritici R3-111a-1]